MGLFAANIGTAAAAHGTTGLAAHATGSVL
jgi:hypothetical protein